MPSIVVVALGDPGVPVICWANAEPDAANDRARRYAMQTAVFISCPFVKTQKTLPSTKSRNLD